MFVLCSSPSKLESAFQARSATGPDSPYSNSTVFLLGLRELAGDLSIEFPEKPFGNRHISCRDTIALARR
jgi:hypothetical protein